MGKMFFGGVPTGADVKRLRDEFGMRDEGESITHGEVEELIGVKRDSNRYKSVTGQWRKKVLDEDNQRLQAIAGFGFRVADPVQRIDEGIGGVKQGTRKVLRAARRAAGTITDDPILGKKNDILQRLAQAMARDASIGIKEIVAPKVMQLPKRPPPQSAQA